MSSPRPERRRTTHVETLHGELCIYEWTTKTVHALNPVAARIWGMCDGTTTVAGMIEAVQRDEGTPAATLIVQHALTQFERAGLLEPDVVVGAPPVSRRRLLRTIGVAAIPVVTSIVAPPPAEAQSSRSRRFDFTGAAQFFTVPAGVTALQVDALGARGAFFVFPVSGVFHPPGNGGRVQATLPVTPGETLTVMVRSQGNLPAQTPGFNGGGASSGGGASGGGASDIRRAITRVLVAGGGGGAGGGALISGAGGNGGGLVGASGAASSGGGGGGGTQAAGGTGGFGGLGLPFGVPPAQSGSPGVSATGGDGGLGAASGGGGGGGYFGGGGGGACDFFPLGLPSSSAGGGGGGSSFTDPSATNVVHTQGANAGDGSVTFSW